ncbi:RNA polymerase sigma factor [Alkalihalobacterium chitinilyticum]|uniref:RNA polymerase sigma factor n=1 Tax=Alkalihalobacterium chitinilyticum TaxID=2980103 RepID=A0ABT5VCY3_9BACI|nr:RNA polymerase sigma factor [Alkalihalobacterium chitinilyticum]MDE5413306.1 RNA polymerase sigma factor [Alkalihalobacterium chitinilyticum]
MVNKDIIKRIKKQDMEALINWFSEREQKFYKVGWAFLHSHHDVEDVFHNTIIKVYENINQLKKEQYFETWVTSIFMNECKAVYRKMQRNQQEMPQVAATLPHEPELKMDIMNGVMLLEEPYKEVIILKFLSDFSQEEIAALLQVPTGTVKSRIYRGLRLLRKELQKGE